MTSRRGYCDGSITQRHDGTWEAKGSLGYQIEADGKSKRVRKSSYGRTRREVGAKLKIVLGDQQGFPVAAERQTVAEFLDRRLHDVATPSV